MYLTCENELKFIFYYLILQVFSCLGNPVKYVHPAAFRGLSVLQHLNLVHTQLHQLPSLQHVGHSLINLAVRGSVHFKGNAAQNFINLRKIEYLYMDRNELRKTPLGLNLIARTIMILQFNSNSINSLTSLEGVEFIKLHRLALMCNNITHLRPEFLITPRLRFLNLEGNQLVALAEVTQYSWGSSLPEHEYMAISLRNNPWHCNGSLSWMLSNLYKLSARIIYAKPPFKPYIRNVDQLLCESPDTRHGTAVLSDDDIENVDISILSLRDLAGKYYRNFEWNIKLNFTNMIFFLITESAVSC